MIFICFVQISLLCYYRQLTDPSRQFSPTFKHAGHLGAVFHGDRVFSSEVLQATLVDTNLTFFREVLGFDDAEIEQETQNAFKFFNERFGLDFSQSEPNDLVIRFFQNATFQPTRRPNGTFATFNSWLLTGNTRSRCFVVAIGGYPVTFIGEQTLRGT